MIKNYLTQVLMICFTFSLSSLVAQPFWTEYFGETDCISSDLVESYPSENGSWSVTETGVNGGTPNIWYVSSQEAGMPAGACGELCSFSSENYNSSLHISSNPFGDVGAIYLETSVGYTDSDVRVESPVINCSGQSNIALNMLYLAGGNPPSDRCSVEYFDGSEWTEIEVLTPTSPDCAPRGMWTSATFSLPASADNNPNVRIGFRWVNVDDGEFSDPSVAIDNISLSGTPISDDFMAALSASTNSVCTGQCIDFTDNSVGIGINNWTWVFEGAEISLSPDQNPSGICYLSEGTYDVTLMVSNGDESETLSIMDFIVVEDCTPEPPDFPEISASSETVQVGGCVDFSVNTAFDQIDSWNWYFEGGSPSESDVAEPTGICYYNAGTYDVSLSITVEDETFDSTFVDFITVGDTAIPIANFNYTPIVCLGYCYSYENTSIGGEEFFWTFEAAETEISYEEHPTEICYQTETGIFNVTLTAVNDIGSTSITQQVYVTNPSDLEAGPDQTIPQGNVAVLSATTSGSGEFTWQPFEQVNCFDCATTETVPLQETTTFTVYYEESGGCVTVDSLTVFVQDPVSVVNPLSNLIQLYPNPGQNLSTLTLPQGQWQVSLIDARGKIIQDFENITSSQLEIDLSSLSRGVYFVNVQSSDGALVKKLVVE